MEVLVDNYILLLKKKHVLSTEVKNNVLGFMVLEWFLKDYRLNRRIIPI